MRYAVLDSGLGLLPTAAALLDADPGAELILALDPDAMPYGDRSAADVTERIRIMAAQAVALAPDAIVVACNTASVHGLEALRAEWEPGIPVIGTVPAIKPAASTGRPFAVWATARTTASRYQRDLLARFAPGRAVPEIAVPGLAEAVEVGDDEAIARAIASAAGRTPAEVGDIVLGCTHYPLVAERIAAALGRPVTLHDSAAAVAAQAVRRAASRAGDTADGLADADGGAQPLGRLLAVLESGRRMSGVPKRFTRYPAGRALARTAVATG